MGMFKMADALFVIILMIFFVEKYHYFNFHVPSGTEVIKLFSCSAQLRLKFILLINVKMPTIVGIFNIYKQDKLLVFEF